MRSILVYIFLLCILFISNVSALSTQRSRPKEWDDLIYGGRYMDLFEPMTVQGKLTSDTWGADNVIPRYIDNGLEDNEYSYWGGNVIVDNKGNHHLYVCRWREDAEKGHNEWPNSEVVHAVSKNSFGPYKVKDVLGKGHNPEAFKTSDGKYIVYVYKAYYVSDSLDGPWQRKEFEFDNRDRTVIEGLSNMSFAQRQDGTYIMVCRGGGIWFSETGQTTYSQVTDASVYPPVEGKFEDPVMWRTSIQYHMIVNDWFGRIAYYLRSKDGVNWKVDPGEAYLPGIAKYEDGTFVDWYKFERIKMLQDKFGRPTQAHFAVIDVIKNDDKGSDNHSSKHICIPLAVGKLIEIIDTDQITSKTQQIRIMIKAEKGFDPHKDIDIDSLRFGASEEVNYGRGSKVIKTKKSGKDLIITFDGKGNGLTDGNFAAKLLGKTKNDKLLYGYARLPWEKYIEPVLSASGPTFTKTDDGYDIEIEVRNFGQVASLPSDIKLVYVKDEKSYEVAEGITPALKPFEKGIIKMISKTPLEKGVEYDMQILISCDSQNQSSFKFKQKP